MTNTCICEKTFDPKQGAEPLEGYENIMCFDCTFNALMKYDVHALLRYVERENDKIMQRQKENDKGVRKIMQSEENDDIDYKNNNTILTFAQEQLRQMNREELELIDLIDSWKIHNYRDEKKQ